MALGQVLNRLRSVVAMARAGQWSTLRYKIAIRMRGLDLAPMTLEETGLSTARSIPYSDSGGPELAEVFRTLPILPTDAIVDIGCGKGGTLITLSQLGFRHLGGVDISPEVIQVARRNVARIGLTNVEFWCGDAGAFTALDQFTYVYCYNPFPCPVMQEVVANLTASIRRTPRTVRIVYKAPRCHGAIINSGVFDKVAEFQFSENPFYVYCTTATAATLSGEQQAS